MKNEWTRDDLPHQHEVWDDFVAGKHSDVFHAVDADDLGEVLDEIVDHLNAHHPKSQQHDCGETIDALNRNRDALVENRDKSISLLQRLLATTEDRWHRAHSIVEAERDQARERLRETETELAKVMSDYQDIEDERDEWKASARLAEQERENWRITAINRAASAVSRDDIDRALINVISNAMNYPTPSQMLGKDTGPLRRKCVDAVCDLFGVEAERDVDPAEAKARELWEIGRGMSVNIEFDDIAPDHRAEYLRIARHLLGQTS